MTLHITTSNGEFKVISPIPLSGALKKRIETSLRAAVQEEESRPIEGLIEKLKNMDPSIGTPRGALAAYKTARGWTQLELSRKTGISQADISKMISGKRPIGLAVAKKLAKAFGVDHRKFL